MEQTFTPQRDVRASEGRQLAKGHHSALPGEGRGDLGLRPGNQGSVFQHQAALRHPPPSLHQNQTPVRLRSVFPGEHLRARQSLVPVLRRRVSHERVDLRPRRSRRARRPEGLGEHRHLLRLVQPPEGGRTPVEAGMHLVKYPKRPESVPAIRITIGLRNAPDSWRDFLYWNAELDES